MFNIFADVEIPSVIDALFPNLPNFIAHILATIVIVILLSKLVYKPYTKAIADRRQKVDELLENAITKDLESKKNHQKAEQLLENAKIESSLIIKTAKVDANSQRDNILRNTKEEVSHIHSQAKIAIESERNKAQSEIDKTIIDSSLALATQILKKEIKKKDNEKLIKDFIDSL